MDSIQLFSGEPITTFLKQQSNSFVVNIREILISNDSQDIKEQRIDGLKEVFQIEVLNIEFDNPKTKKADAKGELIPDDAIASFVVFFIPFQGNRELLTYRPTQSNSNVYTAQLSSDEIVFTIKLESDGKRIRQNFNSFQNVVKEQMRSHNKDINEYHYNLTRIIERERQSVAQELEIQKNLLTDIGFPTKE